MYYSFIHSAFNRFRNPTYKECTWVEILKRIFDVSLGITAGSDSCAYDAYLSAAPLIQAAPTEGSLGAFHNDIIASLCADLLHKNAVLLLHSIIFPVAMIKHLKS